MHYVYGYRAILDFIRTRASSYQTNKRLMFRSSKPAWALWQSDLLYAQALSSYKLMVSDFINKKTGIFLVYILADMDAYGVKYAHPSGIEGINITISKKQTSHVSQLQTSLGSLAI